MESSLRIAGITYEPPYVIGNQTPDTESALQSEASV